MEWMEWKHHGGSRRDKTSVNPTPIPLSRWHHRAGAASGRAFCLLPLSGALMYSSTASTRVFRRHPTHCILDGVRQQSRKRSAYRRPWLRRRASDPALVDLFVHAVRRTRTSRAFNIRLRRCPAFDPTITLLEGALDVRRQVGGDLAPNVCRVQTFAGGYQCSHHAAPEIGACCDHRVGGFHASIAPSRCRRAAGRPDQLRDPHHVHRR